MAAENACAAGDGYGSCMAIQLGFVSTKYKEDKIKIFIFLSN